MMALLAQATEQNGQWIQYVVGAVVLALTGGGAGVGGMVIQKRRNGSNSDEFNKALCDERHKQIDKTFERVEGKIDKGFTRVFDKLDAMHDQNPPKIQT